MRDAGCPSTGSGSSLRFDGDGGWGMRDAGFGMRVAGCGMQDAGYEMRVVGCEMRDARCGDTVIS